MARRTICLGLLLVILGVGTFGMDGFNVRNLAPLIPAMFGTLFVVLGLLAQEKESWKVYLKPLTVGLALLIFLAMSPALVHLPEILAGQAVDRPLSILLQGIVALLVGGYVALSVQSLLTMRSNREAAL